eukprot:GGOE01065553.1.p1 GENE.GGOE01065553.1~~GGOE01065553.1.p1  ORF type:complete len:999 (-),score=139.26 GGOE01065553.1:552-3455(-)
MDAAVHQGALLSCGPRGFRDNIRVVVRVRPNPTEDADDTTSSPLPLSCPSDVVLCVGHPYRPSQPRRFAVDRVLWSGRRGQEGQVDGEGQAEVYCEVGTRTLALALDGFNSSVLAYGPTGTGKTFTMMGTTEAPGLIPRLMKDLFASFSTDCMSGPSSATSSLLASEGRRLSFSATMAFYEICNERVRDLLDFPFDQLGKRVPAGDPKAFRLINDPKLGPVLKGLSTKAVRSWRQAAHFLERGQAQQTTSDVAYRTHSIVQLNVQRDELLGSVGGKDIHRIHTSRIHLVDLAGSERARGRADGSVMAEAPFLNKSLATLGRVIAALAAGQSHGSCQNSLLTQLLAPSLGGGTATTIIATVSQTATDLEDTLATLRTMSLARQVVNPVKGGPGLSAAMGAVQVELQQLRRSVAGGAAPLAQSVAEAEALLGVLRAQEMQEREECQSRRRRWEAERAALEQRQLQDDQKQDGSDDPQEDPTPAETAAVSVLPESSEEPSTDEVWPMLPGEQDTAHESEGDLDTATPSSPLAFAPMGDEGNCGRECHGLTGGSAGPRDGASEEDARAPMHIWAATFISPRVCPDVRCPLADDAVSPEAMDPHQSIDAAHAAPFVGPPALPQATHGGTVTAAEIGCLQPGQSATLVGIVPPSPSLPTGALNPRDPGKAWFPHRSASQPRPLERTTRPAQRAAALVQTPRTATPRTLPGEGALLRTPRLEAQSPPVLRVIQPTASPVTAADASKYFHSKAAAGLPSGPVDLHTSRLSVVTSDMPRAVSMPIVASPRPPGTHWTEEALTSWTPRPLSSRGQPTAGSAQDIAARLLSRTVETPRVGLVSPRDPPPPPRPAGEDCRTPRMLGSARGTPLNVVSDLPTRSPDPRRCVEDGRSLRSTAMPRNAVVPARDVTAKAPVPRKLSLPLADKSAGRLGGGSTTPRFPAQKPGQGQPSASWRSRTTRQLSDLPAPAWMRAPFR